MKVTIDEFEIHIFGDKGWFEWVGGTNEDPECVGGLWFYNKVLQDYDGVFELPEAVIKGIEQLGYYIGEDTSHIKLIQDLCWAIEVLRARLPDDYLLSKSEIQAIMIQEKALRTIEN